MSAEVLTYQNLDLEKLGFMGLPKNLTYFKFECDACDPNKQIAEVTVRFCPTKQSIESVEKKFKLVEI